MPELTLTHLDMVLLACGTSLFAGFVRGLTGFGGPAVISLVLTLFYSPLSVLPKVMVIDLAANVALLRSTYKEVQWRTCLTVSAATIAGVYLGIYALVHIDPHIARKVIALVVAGTTALLLSGWRYQHEPGLVIQILAGLATGIALGATGIALTAVLFFFGGLAKASVARANMIYWGFISTTVVIGTHVVIGTLSFEDIWRSLVIGITYFSSSILGNLAFQQIGERNFRRVVMWLLVVLSGVALAA